jgi:glycine cleavage system H lipoate-binding protein
VKKKVLSRGRLVGAYTVGSGFKTFPTRARSVTKERNTASLPSVIPKVLREDGTECDVDEVGYLVIVNPWPGLARGFWNDSDRKRFGGTCDKLFPGYYFTGYGAKRDAEGHCWLMGKIDDGINVLEHWPGADEVKKALASHPFVAESALIRFPHSVEGREICALVILKAGIEKSEDLREELLAHTRKLIGPIAAPDKLQFVETLPRMRSGKIMRRILSKIAEERIEVMGNSFTDSRFPGEVESPVETGSTHPREKEGQESPEENLLCSGINKSLFYHPGHTWMKVEEADEVRVGLDRFLGETLEKVKSVILPQSGRRVLQGENLCLILQQEGILSMVSPSSGSILSVNPKLKDQPDLVSRDPLGDGFLLTLKPKNLQRDQRHLFSGETALSWYQKELERFKAAVISDLSPDQKGLGMTMQDGRIKFRGIKKSIDPERYIQLVSAFLRDGEKDFI